MSKFNVTHKILRAEYLTLTIEADDAEDARTKGLSLLDEVSTSCYEPGDVEDEGDAIGVEPASDDAELTDLDELE